MVDNSITLFSSKNYSYVQFMHPTGMVARKFVYIDGKELDYGDKAEILGAVSGLDFKDFIAGALSETYFTREHYWFTFGFQPADFDNEEIKENNVKIHYAGVDNTITKIEFYELCLMLCEAKLNGLDLIEDKAVKLEDLLSIKSQLAEKINAC